MKVKALQKLYVDLKIRKEGDVFELENQKDFSSRSMEKIDGRKKVKKTVIEDASSDEESAA